MTFRNVNCARSRVWRL